MTKKRETLNPLNDVYHIQPFASDEARCTQKYHRKCKLSPCFTNSCALTKKFDTQVRQL